MARVNVGYGSTLPGAPTSGFVGQSLCLSIVYPRELAGLSIPLRLGLTLGRSEESDVSPILHPTISRRHAQIRAGLGGLPCLVDLESRNGSRVNGARVHANTPAPLVAQTVVRLGDVLGVVDEPSTGRFDDYPVLPGASPRIARARAELARAAPDPAPLLVIGETGTGKERIAGEAHRASGRKGPYLVLNCAELSPQLIESELFGHERGAFTGAIVAKKGLFLAADGGTLFLDEIGELPLELQAKLLRVLQEREVRPVGAARPIPTDVRVVAATNRDLPERVAEGSFRRDLYARLALWELRLPPLRDRRQDLLPWIDLFFRTWCEGRGTHANLGFAPDAAERILLHAWLDNLRGLNRLVHRLSNLGLDRPVGTSALAAAMPELGSDAGGDPVDRLAVSADLAPGVLDVPGTGLPGTGLPGTGVPGTGVPGIGVPDESRGASTLPPAERPSREDFIAIYEGSGRSVRATAKHFGRDRRQIYRWLEAFGIRRDPETD